MSARYAVGVYDCAGEFAVETLATFDETVTLAARWRREYPGKVVCVSNLDRCDYDTNGLTEDERDALDEAGL